MHLFAAAAQAVHARSVSVELERGDSLADVAQALELHHPQLQSLLRYSRWAIDQQFATLDTVVCEGQEIALIPPVSGG